MLRKLYSHYQKLEAPRKVKVTTTAEVLLKRQLEKLTITLDCEVVWTGHPRVHRLYLLSIRQLSKSRLKDQIWYGYGVHMYLLVSFSLLSTCSINMLLKTQRCRCAGCGTKVEAKYANTFRYCHYLGRYFCTGCHTGKRARLPQMIIHQWDFGP